MIELRAKRLRRNYSQKVVLNETYFGQRSNKAPPLRVLFRDSPKFSDV